MDAANFIRRQLGTAGWAPINFALAKRLCSNLGTEHLTFNAWAKSPQTLPRMFNGAFPVMVRVEGFGDVLVRAHSAVHLIERMSWLGVIAANVKGFEAPDADTKAPSKAAPAPIDSNVKDRKLAEQEPPAHDCALRREILAARAKLERQGETFETPATVWARSLNGASGR